jgi:alpha-N-arabinofuranosidase
MSHNTFRWLQCLSLALALASQPTIVPAQTQRASINIDARKVENQISPLLYGQFLEFMFEGIKGGLHAELVRNRSFEEPPNIIGLSRNWDRYPDDRNDDYALSFGWDEQSSYPEPKEHSLRVRAGDGVIRRHGIFQSRIPVRAGVEYRGYVWLKTADYQGLLTVALESDVDPGKVYASSDVTPQTKSDWRRYEFTLRPTTNDPLAR